MKRWWANLISASQVLFFSGWRAGLGVSKRGPLMPRNPSSFRLGVRNPCEKLLRSSTSESACQMAAIQLTINHLNILIRI